MIKKMYYLFLAILFSIFLTLSGCSVFFSGGVGTNGGIDGNGGDGANGDGDGDEAQDLVELAIEAMKNDDWDSAYDLFSQAVALDKDNCEAVMGYSMLNIASIAVDQNIQSLASNNMGIVDYPTTMKDIFNPDNIYDDTWMNEVTNPWTEGTIFFPNISGLVDQDDDGDIDFNDYLMSLALYFTGHNSGFNSALDAVSKALGDRLDLAIAAIENSGCGSFSITWDMWYDTEPDPDSGGWPYIYEDGNPVEPITFTIGKAELLLVAAYLKQIKMFAHILKVYDLTLPLASYWAAFNPGGTAYDDPEPTYPPDNDKPFSGDFLTLRSQDDLDDAKQALLDSLVLINSAISSIKGRKGTDNFTFSPSSQISEIADSWDDINNLMDMMSIMLGKIQDSINDIKTIYFPTDFDAYGEGPGGYWQNYSNAANWPQGPGEDVAGLNLGVYFSSTAGLFSFLLDINSSNGEPRFYSFNDGSFVEVTSAPDPYSDGIYYIKIPDISLGGVIPVDNIPTDYPGSQHGYFNMNWNDSNSDYAWNTEEQIYWAEIDREMEGLILLSEYGLYDGAITANNPETYYSNPLDILDYILYHFWAPIEDNDALRAALNNLGDKFEFTGPPITFLDNTSIYIHTVSSELVWHSLTAKGTISNGYESTGSFWWALMKLAADGTLWD